jgi:hypothetical protein
LVDYGDAVSSGRWRVREDVEVNCVVPHKLVTPVLMLDPDGSPPAAIEVRRTFETFPRRLLAKAMRATSCRPRERRLVEYDDDVARYETWPADCYPPWRRPTQFEFHDPSGAWGGLSDPLRVFQNGVAIRVPQAEYNLRAKGGYAGAHGEVGIGVKNGEELTMLLDVTVDPEIEPFAFSPAQGLGDIEFESYVDTSLVEIEEAVAAEGLSSEGIQDVFAEDYGDFIGENSGLIFVSFQPSSANVKPGVTSRVTATLHGEREGGMLLVLGARHLGTGEVFFSDLLPLIWQPEKDAAHAGHEEAMRKQATLRQKVAGRPRLRPLP